MSGCQVFTMAQMECGVSEWGSGMGDGEEAFDLWNASPFSCTVIPYY